MPMKLCVCSPEIVNVVITGEICTSGDVPHKGPHSS